MQRLVDYVKTNWKHLLAGGAVAYVGQHYGPAATAKLTAILKILGVS